jgi:hypothetical protein
MREQHEEQQQKQEQQERQEVQLLETRQREHDTTAQPKEMHPKTSRSAKRYGSSRCRYCGRHVRRCGN